MKSIELLAVALQCAELPHGTLDPEELSARVEGHLYHQHRGTNERYKQAVRSRIFNLRKNQHLRENVLTGSCTLDP